ncbi:MAG: hypothetical protein IKT39_03390 [Clostridia bacterium]|nr:hypothetical protein [Clostridia bacterium]
MAELILSAKSPQKIILESKSKNQHNNLGNLSFDKSGHTGFQKELTAQQLANIQAVSEKVDKAYVDSAIQSAILDSWEVAV